MRKILKQGAILTGLILFSLHSCVKDDTENARPEDPDGNILTVQEAQEYFEKHQLLVMTRSNHIKTYRGMVSDFEPVWNDAKAASKSNSAVVEAPITTSSNFRVIATYNNNNGDIAAYTTRVSQKLVVVKDANTGKMANYVLSLIPDKEFSAKNKGDISSLFRTLDAKRISRD